MTGPEHYHEAEVLAECAAREMDSGADLRAEATLQLGQLHATLALAAAVALGARTHYPVTNSDASSWDFAVKTSGQRPPVVLPYEPDRQS